MKIFALGIIGLLAASQAMAALTIKQSVKGKDDRGEFDIQYIQLTREFANKTIRNKLNKTIRASALEQICDKNPERKGDMSSSLTMDVGYSSDHAISLLESYETSCGMSFNGGTRGALYSLTTGDLVEIEDEIENKTAFKNIALNALVKAAPQGDGNDCSYKREDLESKSLEYSVVGNDLVISPYYAQVEKVCGFDTKIPLTHLSRMVKKDSTLAKIVNSIRSKNGARSGGGDSADTSMDAKKD
jgi:hypothetical protein